ncbi:unnamed protein product [Urochloa humidicola]
MAAMASQNDAGSSSSSGELTNGGTTARPEAEVRRLHSCGDLLSTGGGSSSSSGELRGGRNARPADARSRSYGDILTVGRGDGGGRRRRGRRGDDYAYQKRWETTGYVSFEDLIGTSSYWDEPGEPLVRLGRPRNRRIRSPGPLGTRRGSAMHGLVKKYVNPFIGFLAGIFCCTVSS